MKCECEVTVCRAFWQKKSLCIVLRAVTAGLGACPPRLSCYSHHHPPCIPSQIMSSWILPLTLMFKGDSDAVIKDAFCATWTGKDVIMPLSVEYLLPTAYMSQCDEMERCLTYNKHLHSFCSPS